MKRRSTRHTRKSSGRIMSMTPSNMGSMQGLIRRGPVTIILVFSTSCPHCHTYMPIWNKLCKTKGRKANMISMEASTYQKTPLSEKKSVSGVPTVLYVNKQGEIVEIDTPRDTEKMTEVIRNSPRPEFTKVLTDPKPMSGPMMPKPMTPSLSPMMPDPMMPKPMSLSPSPMMSAPMMPKPMSLSPKPMVPGTEIINSPLKPLPATGGSRGGNWDALMLAAQQAAPAAALLGAYAAFPMQRSSGLGPARRTRRKSRR